MFWGRKKIHKISQARLRSFEDAWQKMSPLEAVIDVIGSRKEIILDVGCGRGETTLFYAKRYPNKHVIACDVFLNGLVHLSHRLQEEGVVNVTVVREDAAALLPHIPPKSLQSFLCFFPDPWPKKRHKKRRLLVQSGVVDHIERILMVGGSFVWRTDSADYIEDVLPLLKKKQFFVEREGEDISCVTSYEKKAREACGVVYTRVFIKTAQSG